MNSIPPMPAAKSLDAFYLEARARLLDLAAILDRIDRGDGAAPVNTDARAVRLREGLQLLMQATPGRAEAVQRLFSLEYDADWPRPLPRY
jgi:hypothetical protein